MALQVRSSTSRRKNASPSWMKKKNTGECVLELLPNDVLLGRGSGPNDHKGNIQFRELIKERKQEYSLTNNRQEKVVIASDIVDQIFKSGGRFLKKLNDVKAANVLPKILERLGGKEKNNYDGGFNNREPRDVYEIQGVAIIMEKTKQALRQGQQKRPNGGRSPTSQHVRTSLQSTTPLNTFISGGDGSPLNGFIDGVNDDITTTTNKKFDNKNNIKFSSSLGNLNVNAKEKLLSVNKDIASIILSPTLFSANQQQQQEHPNTSPTRFISLQQQIYQLEQQQQLQEEKYQLEKKQYELQQLELEKHKQSLEQNIVLKLQQDQLRKLQDLQKLSHQHCNNQNSNRLTTTNDNDTRHYPQQPEEQEQQQYDQKPQQQQQEHHSTQHHHRKQKNNSPDVLTDEFAAYTTTLAGMEDTRATGSNNNNNKHRAYVRTGDSEHSLGDLTEILKMNSTDHNNDDDGDDTHDKNFDSISTMMLSMKDFSVKDCKSRHSHSTLGIIDGLSDDNMVGGFLTTGLMSAISIMSMANNSKDSLFQSERVDSSVFRETSHNASWDTSTAAGSSFNHSKNMFSSIIGVTCH